MAREQGGEGPGGGAPSPPALGRHNPRVMRLRRLVRREENDLTVVDGLKLVREVAAAGVPVVELFTVESHLEAVRSDPALRRVLGGGRVYLLDAGAIADLAPTRQTQGLLAVVPVPVARVRPDGTTVYLDRVQDPGNLGAAVRCAAAFGATGVACSPGCADPFSPRGIRASGGQTLLLAVQSDAPFAALADAFRSAGGEAVGTAGGAGLALRSWRPRPPVLLALGNEGQGLAAEIAAACDRLVTIPIAAGVESLNVAVTAGIVLASLSGVAGSPIIERQAQKGRRR